MLRFASMGLRSFDELQPHMLRRRLAHDRGESYAELFRRLEPGELLADPPRQWAHDWHLADPDHFVP